MGLILSRTVEWFAQPEQQWTQDTGSLASDDSMVARPIESESPVEHTGSLLAICDRCTWSQLNRRWVDRNFTSVSENPNGVSCHLATYFA